MAAWLAAALGATLAVSGGTGHAEIGSAMALGLVLTAVPTIPVNPRDAMRVMGIRGATVMAGALLVVLVAGHPAVLAIAAVAAAVVGGLLDRVGPTAGLAVVLIAVDAPTAVWPYAVGAAMAPVAWTAWYGCRRGVRKRTASTTADGAVRRSVDVCAAYPHALRVGAAVGAAVLVASWLPHDLVGAHWLITSVLLTVQPAAADTGLRLAQRLSGNTVGALIAAVILGAHPSTPAVAVLTMLLFTLAMALRPVNYTWWAVTGPPVLLVISEYPSLFPWYEGGIRLAMNIGGAVIVAAVVFGAPALCHIVSRPRRSSFPVDQQSDSVYKIETRRMQ